MEKDYHLSNSKTDEAEHLESAAPQLQLHQNNTDNEAYKSYHGDGKVKEVANVRSRVRGFEVSKVRGFEDSGFRGFGVPRARRVCLDPRDDL